MTAPLLIRRSLACLAPVSRAFRRGAATLSATLVDENPERGVPPVGPGTVLEGRFRVEERIGSGAMGDVYAGRHLELEQPIAIKLLRAQGTSSGRALRRFLSEARAAAKLDSPHVARVLDAGVFKAKRGEAVPFIVMERLIGRDLSAVLAQRGRLPYAEAVDYVIQACRGAAEAHAAGIVHRDLKPANLFLTTRRDGSPLIKLLDFGISKNLAPASLATELPLTREGEAVGSPSYMSPEQVRGRKNMDTRADIWSLGVILYELLTGKLAFVAATIPELYVEILHRPPPSIREHAPDVPLELASVVLRCLQKECRARYATVDELAAALAPFGGARPFDVAPTSACVVDAPPVDDGAQVTTVVVRRRRRNWHAAPILAGAVGLGVVVAAAASRGGAAGASPTTSGVGKMVVSVPRDGRSTAPPPPEPASRPAVREPGEPLVIELPPVVRSGPLPTVEAAPAARAPTLSEPPEKPATRPRSPSPAPRARPSAKPAPPPPPTVPPRRRTDG